MTTSPKPTKDEALRQAEALIYSSGMAGSGPWTDAAQKTLSAIREALAQPADDDKAEEEILQLIGERDRREEIINQLCDAVLGTDRSEWSSAYHFEDAVREVDERMDADDKAGGDKTVVWIGKMDFEALKNRGRVTATLYNEPVGNASNEIPLYTRPQPQAEALRVPDGYALVPVEPTDEMRDAGNEVVLDRGKLFRAWKAMLSAAPQPEAQDIPAIFKEQAS